MSLQQPARIFRRAPQRVAVRRARRIAATVLLAMLGLFGVAVLAQAARDAGPVRTHLATGCATQAVGAEASLQVRRLRC